MPTVSTAGLIRSQSSNNDSFGTLGIRADDFDLAMDGVFTFGSNDQLGAPLGRYWVGRIEDDKRLSYLPDDVRYTVRNQFEVCDC